MKIIPKSILWDVVWILSPKYHLWVIMQNCGFGNLVPLSLQSPNLFQTKQAARNSELLLSALIQVWCLPCLTFIKIGNFYIFLTWQWNILMVFLQPPIFPSYQLNISCSWLLKVMHFDSSVGKESACNAEDPGMITGLGRSAGEGIGYPFQYSWVSLVTQLVKESVCSAGDLGLIPELGRSPGEGKGYLLQYSGLENSMDCIVHGVAKSWTWLCNFHFLNFSLKGKANKQTMNCIPKCEPRHQTCHPETPQSPPTLSGL